MSGKYSKTKIDNATLLRHYEEISSKIIRELNATEEKSKKVNWRKVFLILVQIIGTVIILLCWRYQSGEIAEKTSTLNRLQRVRIEYYNILNLCYQFSIRRNVIAARDSGDLGYKKIELYNRDLANQAFNHLLLDSVIYDNLPIGEDVEGLIITQEWKDQMNNNFHFNLGDVIDDFDGDSTTQLENWVREKEKVERDIFPFLAYYPSYAERIENELKSSGENYKRWYLFGSILIVIGLFKDIPFYKKFIKRRN